jgi:hypothetical protein
MLGAYSLLTIDIFVFFYLPETVREFPPTVRLFSYKSHICGDISNLAYLQNYLVMLLSVHP